MLWFLTALCWHARRNNKVKRLLRAPCRAHWQAVTTAVAFQFGLGSALFAVALCFSLVVMYDAAGVRRHAGMTQRLMAVREHHAWFTDSTRDKLGCYFAIQSRLLQLMHASAKLGSQRRRCAVSSLGWGTMCSQFP